jgi:hypothetical protein
LIGKTALALAAATLIASTAALLVGAAGFAMFWALAPVLGPAGAAACVAGAAGLFLLIVLFVANLRQSQKVEPRPVAAPHLQSLVGSLSETFNERPLLTLGLTVLTGLAATRDPNLLKDLWSAVLHKQDPDASR